MSAIRSSGVYRKELDRSQAPTPVSTSSAAIAVYSQKGPIGKALLTVDGDDYVNKWGQPIYTRDGYGGVCASRFLRVGSELLVSRVVGGNYTFSNKIFGIDTSTTPVSGTENATFINPKKPETVDFDAVSTFLSAFLVYGLGPGSWYNNLLVQILSSNMLMFPQTTGSNPTATAQSIIGGGGILVNNSTYTYAIIANNELGPTYARTTNDITIDNSANPNSANAQVTWPRVAGASGYLVYRKTNDNDPTPNITPFEYYTSVNQVPESVAQVTFFDEGQFSQDSDQPLVVSGGNTGIPNPTNPSEPLIYTPTPEFQLLVFNPEESITNAQETWNVTFNMSLDGFGNQQEIEAVINDENIGSQLIRIVKNDNYIPVGEFINGDTPIFYPTAKVALANGNDGASYSQITTADFNRALSVFDDPEDLQLRILIEGGRPDIQPKLIEIATNRLDCVGVLDMPTAYQETSAAINYRKNILNANTPRAAIYTPDLRVYDDTVATEIYIPPSGDVAATYAYTDRVSNVWQSPAGLNRGILNIRGIRHKYGQQERDRLVNAQINMIKNSPGLGLAVWEQLTLQSKLSANSYVSVRRMLDALQLAISAALQFQLQELPTDDLIRLMSNTISSILDPIQSGGGIKAYTIKTDASAGNTADTAIRGLFKIRLFIVPNIPVREIELTTIITKDTVAFEEVIPQAA